jgi:uncharacterized protein
MPALSKSSAVLCGLAAAAWALFAPLPASAASFPCDKAKTAVEVAICGSPQVSELDEYLGRYYAAARGVFRHAEDCLVSDQRNWLQTVRNACKDTDCLKQAYFKRLAVLHAVQPGATSLRKLELPAEPSLVWIVPPAADQVAAPRNRQTAPLVASGRLINEVATGDGFVLDAGAGRKLLVNGLMFLEAPTADALAQLSKDTTARYQVRGRAEPGASPPVAFSASQCTYVYRAAK